MKFIDIPALSALARALTHDGPDCSVHTRLEAYSCKPTNRDKKLFKSLEHAYADDHAHSSSSPPSGFFDVSEEEDTPFGPLSRQSARKTLYLLIATLNAAFPDHEFSDVKPAQFSREQAGAAAVLHALSASLAAPLSAPSSSYPGTSASPDLPPPPSLLSSYPSPLSYSLPTRSSGAGAGAGSLLSPPISSSTHPALFRALDDAIGLADCDVYAYAPDLDSDPLANDDEGENDDWDAASVGDEDGTESDEEDATFAFELEFDHDAPRSDGEEDGDLPDGAQFKSPRRRQKKRFVVPPVPSYASGYSSSPPSSATPTSKGRAIPAGRRVGIRMKRRGGLLWSSHWFFVNRKLKRILFVSVWARSRGMSRRWSDSDESELGASWSEDVGERTGRSERFRGWEGAADVNMNIASAWFARA
ncbi:Maf1-domain-containing protein [Punctularia strigosozonata HHB-11173 SS5]|uniref:Maf1-domain-containing protein n=1 Tax=Punctularia strigosozonata (strain HHB-11173) TaxID=741275 RepID=UPI000441766C|nr:Maf1-domain-containing protein [Punctularia strigosozonata HHB-11173 SS5]EIN09835.1 Maf1-domain-containing protein [Punctularia strigosozonata HHB-11173 SS5]